jgi:hypothetical protein
MSLVISAAAAVFSLISLCKEVYEITMIIIFRAKAPGQLGLHFRQSKNPLFTALKDRYEAQLAFNRMGKKELHL